MKITILVILPSQTQQAREASTQLLAARREYPVRTDVLGKNEQRQHPPRDGGQFRHSSS